MIPLRKKTNKQKSTNFMYISKNSKLPHILIKIKIVSYLHLSKAKVVYFPCDHHMKAENWRTRSPWSSTPFADWLIDSSRCSQALTCPPLPDRAGNCYSVKSELSWRKRRGSKWLSGLRLLPRGIQPRGTGGIHSSLKSHGGYCSYFVKYIVQLKKTIYWSFSQNHTIIITLYRILISDQLLICEAFKKKKKEY